MLAIGLVGAKGAGKTTAFSMIKDAYPGVQEITLAGFLKDVCSEVFEIERNFFDSHKTKESPLDRPILLTEDHILKIYDKYDFTNIDYRSHVLSHIGDTIFTTPRHIAQYVGTEILRSIDPNIHCKKAIEGKYFEMAVITDIRFPDELSFFKDNSSSFFCLYLQNDKAEQVTALDGHRSESYLPLLASESIRIDNNCDLDEMRRRVLSVVNFITQNNSRGLVRNRS